MAENKTEGAGAATVDAPGENGVQVTFLPEGKTVQFEHGKLPYKDHGKEESLLDVALNNVEAPFESFEQGTKQTERVLRVGERSKRIGVSRFLLGRRANVAAHCTRFHKGRQRFHRPGKTGIQCSPSAEIRVRTL